MTDNNPLFRRALSAQLGPHCGVAVRQIAGASTDSLFHSEQDAIGKAILPRRREFAAGRAAARQALEQIGQRPSAIPMGTDRAPCWPAGIVGSISHTKRHAFAAVMKQRSGRSAIGIDVEEIAPLPQGVSDVVLLGSEIHRTKSWPAQAAELAGVLHFCAKEAAYKAIYPISRHVMGFEALELTFDHAAGRFEARLSTDIPVFPQNTCFDGAFAVLPGTVLCSVTIIG